MPDVSESAVALGTEIDLDVREGRFQRWLIAGMSSVLAGLEVSYEHYRGSYSRRVMYTPVILSVALAGGGIAGFFSKRSARKVLRAISIVTLGDSVVGFYFHTRGVYRKPDGWRLPIVNMVMGPPIFAPLLFGVSAYLGFVASFLRRSDDDNQGPFLPQPVHTNHWVKRITGEHGSIS